jgi:hypothetical protein
MPMPYALFENDEKLGRAFPTEEDVWSHAEGAGLVEVEEQGKFLSDHYSIKLCPPDEMEEKQSVSNLPELSGRSCGHLRPSDPGDSRRR